jgi:hypothetical protein
LFHATYGDYYVSGFVHGSSYWLQCEVDNSDVHSDTSISLTAGVDGGKLGNAQGGGAYNQKNNIAKKSTNVTRHLSGHDLSKLSTGEIDLSTGAKDMVNF